VNENPPPEEEGAADAPGSVRGRAKAVRSITDAVVRGDGTASDADKEKLRFVVDGRIAVLVELDISHGLSRARADFLQLFADTLGDSNGIKPALIGRLYLRCLLTEEEIRQLCAADLAGPKSIHRVWADYRVEAHIDRSASTVKADAAARSYGTSGEGVVWAVIDSGINKDHPHFKAEANLTAPPVEHLHRDFTPMLRTNDSPADDPAAALQDEFGHGTHVAGIIAGSMPVAPAVVKIAKNRPDKEDMPNWEDRKLEPGRALTSMAPKTLLVSLKVLNDDGFTSSSVVMSALDYVRETNVDRQVIHGVNLSVGCDWFPDLYAAGQSPLCRAVDDLVATGVVVVVSAGNNGASGALHGASSDVTGQLCTITDPGNAARAITVGSTHRDAPHTYGISYTSSKGPTLDGRLKPDLVAPGERITSAATGALRKGVLPLGDDPTVATYIEDSGTSMAAPHVSGAIAAFLSVRTEYKGKPEEIKRLFRQNATSLDRHEFYQGAGMLDLMRVLANV
jgi:subtilisin family serine protease